ncbi:MAG: hypothetical protein AB4206_11495 [Xenococcaceae cyanobacterium]
MRDRLNQHILAHQGHSHQQVEPTQSPAIQPQESLTEEQNQPQTSSDTNNTVEIQPEAVTKITNSSSVNAVTIAGEVILFSLIITPVLLTWIKSRVSQ